MRLMSLTWKPLSTRWRTWRRGSMSRCMTTLRRHRSSKKSTMTESMPNQWWVLGFLIDSDILTTSFRSSKLRPQLLSLLSCYYRTWNQAALSSLGTALGMEGRGTNFRPGTSDRTRLSNTLGRMFSNYATLQQALCSRRVWMLVVWSCIANDSDHPCTWTILHCSR